VLQRMRSRACCHSSKQIATRATLRVAAFYSSKRDRVKYEKVNDYSLHAINSTISIID